MSATDQTLTGEQIRAARALARLNQARLAALTRLSVETIKRLERIQGPVDANYRTLAAIRSAFGDLGVTFDHAVAAGGLPWRESVSLERRTGADAAPALSSGWDADLPPGEGDCRVIFQVRLEGDSAALGSPGDLTGAGFRLGGWGLQVVEGARADVARLFAALDDSPNCRDINVLECRASPLRLFKSCLLFVALTPEEQAELELAPDPRDDGQEMLSPPRALGVLLSLHEMRRGGTGALGA